MGHRLNQRQPVFAKAQIFGDIGRVQRRHEPGHEGNVGLMKAVKRFDPDYDVRLVSFAVHWIRAEIHEFVLKNWRIVKVATTKAQRKLFFNLRKKKKTLAWLTDAETKAVAKDLGVKPTEVTEMEKRLHSRAAASNIPLTL